MQFFQSLGQDFTSLVESVKQYFNAPLLFSIYPADIQAVLLAVTVVVLIIAIKRAVIS